MAESPQEDLIITREDSTAVIRLNRPKKLNTMTRSMSEALPGIVREINGDASIRAVIIEGAGDKAFSAGSDVKALDDYGSGWEIRNRTEYCRELLAIRKPVIAAVRGYAIGGGLEIALCADIRLADPTAKFGAGEIKLGWHGGGGVTQLLPRLIGAGNAGLLLFTGDIIDAETAYRMGLVQELTEDGKLADRTRGLAARIAANAPIAAEAIKTLLRVSMNAPLDVGLKYENETFLTCFNTADARRGIEAFKAKEQPRFEGN